MLYFVATPIGNLKDITYRAVEVLSEVDEIACEDTRHSLVLLEKYGIKKPLFSYHKFNEKEVSEKICEKLEKGKNIAVISDAGMPVISDPGNILVKTLIERGLEYTVVPGACACVSALVLSGVDSARFAFIGFLPQKQTDRKTLLEKYKNLDITLVFYSAPHDIEKDIKTIYEVFGDRKAVAVKEITKIYESVEQFNLRDGLSKEPKGEYVLIVEGKTEEDFSTVPVETLLKKYIDEGMDKKEALKTVAKIKGVSKSSLYKYTIDEKQN